MMCTYVLINMNNNLLVKEVAKLKARKIELCLLILRSLASQCSTSASNLT